MTFAVNILAEQGRTLTATTATSPTVKVEQGRLFSALNNPPSTGIKAEQGRALVAATPTSPVHVEQGRMLVAALGRTENRRIRAWTFSLDGHDFYVLRLGESATVVYDFTTESWAAFDSPDLDYWRMHVGQNWIGMNGNSLAANASTNVVCGDDRSGYLFTLNPYSGTDEDTDLSVNTFTRKVLGGIPMRTRKTQPVGGAYLTCSMGSPQDIGSYFTLRTSNDYGKTWTDHGSITSVTQDYTQEFSWRSLGLIRAPGKAFEISDNGASVRIDTLEIR